MPLELIDITAYIIHLDIIYGRNFRYRFEAIILVYT